MTSGVKMQYLLRCTIQLIDIVLTKRSVPLLGTSFFCMMQLEKNV